MRDLDGPTAFHLGTTGGIARSNGDPRPSADAIIRCIGKEVCGLAMGMSEENSAIGLSRVTTSPDIINSILFCAAWLLSKI